MDEINEINLGVVSTSYEIERERLNENVGCGGCGCLSLKLFLMVVIGMILFRLILELFSFVGWMTNLTNHL